MASGGSPLLSKNPCDPGKSSPVPEDSMSKQGYVRWVAVATFISVFLCMTGVISLVVYCLFQHGRIAELEARLVAVEKLCRGPAHYDPSAGSNFKFAGDDQDPRYKRSKRNRVRHSKKAGARIKTLENKLAKMEKLAKTSPRYGHVVPPDSDLHWYTRDDSNRTLKFRWEGVYPAYSNFSGNQGARTPFIIDQPGVYFVYGQVTFNGRNRGENSTVSQVDPCSYHIMLVSSSESRKDFTRKKMILLSGHTNQANNGEPLYEESSAIDSVFTAGAFRLEKRDELYMRLEQQSTSCRVLPHYEKTFFGLHLLGPA